MFNVVLPYSNKDFYIAKLSFLQIFEISRLLDNNDDVGIITYLVNHFDISNLCIIDKFFVLLKARELYIDETLSLTIEDANLKLPLESLTSKLYDIGNYEQIIAHNNIKVTIDVPLNFIIPGKLSVYDHIIKQIQIDDIIINFNGLTDKEQHQILTSLPSSMFKYLKSFVNNTEIKVVLYKGKASLNMKELSINFLTTDTFFLIKSLYSDYTLHSCREILFHLAKRLSSDTLLNSPMSDIKFYLNEIDKENNKSGNSGNINGIV